MNKNIVLGVVAFGGLALVASSQFSSSEETTRAGDEYVETEQASMAVLQEAVVVHFPTYPDVEVSQSRESVGDDGRTFYSLSLVAEASIADINEWYRNALSQDGWSIKSDKNVAGYQIIQAEKENLFTSMQAANGDSGTAVISQQAQIRP